MPTALAVGDGGAQHEASSKLLPFSRESQPVREAFTQK
jgi:hypothetical protein